MTTLYVRTHSLKESLSDQEVLDYWKFGLEELGPAVERVAGVRSLKFYSGPGALRSNITILIEMDDASVYERLLLDSEVRKGLGRLYGSWELSTAQQSFHREITAELIGALTSTS